MDEKQARKEAIAGENGLWGDSQQFMAEEQPTNEPKVHLLWMTPDPLGALAAFSSMYSGRVVRDLGELTHEDRMQAWADVQKTHLRAPMEAVKMHFLLEGVDRAFTHQLVRQRTAVYAQESQRFAVIDNLFNATSLPPSLEGTVSIAEDDEVFYGAQDNERQQWRNEWDSCLHKIDKVYKYLVNQGMPAEEARGLLPNCTLARVHYATDLRNLLEHAGNRLCTQAQFHWRAVFGQIRDAIREYWQRGEVQQGNVVRDFTTEKNAAEFAAIAEAFKPICYQLGECPFQASFDRACTIRDRVNFFHKRSVPSAKWGEEYTEPSNINDPLPWSRYTEPGESGQTTDIIPAIRDEEWLLDPGAARR